MSESAARPPGLVIGDAAASAQLRRWRLTGLLILAATFGVTALWSTLAPLSSAVIASGTVKVVGNRKMVQHQEGGVIKAILVRDGDRVAAGDVLIRLDETRAGASQGVLQTQYDAALALQARLIAERDGQVSISWPAELLARRNEPRVSELLQTQQSQFAARRASLQGHLSILDRQIAATQAGIEGLDSQRKAKQTQLESLQTELAGLTDLLSKGMVEKTKYRNLEREIARVEGERAEHMSDIASARATISERELQKFQARKTFNEEVTEQLRTVQTELFDYTERMQAADYVLAQTELRAPVAGTVTDLKTHTEGGVVAPGQVLLEIVPTDERLMIEAKVRPQDVDRVRTGLAAGVKLSSFDQRTLPELDGSVSYLSADILEEERTGQSYFLVRIEVPEEELSRLGGQKIHPGMLADVFVRTGDRTFLAYLLDPIVSSFNKAWRER
ncbi:HlyD family type I secretion periplasmic adaptor subunit [Methyloversatilis sp. XJ19-49]|uniref:HlyD family type I secretion periplasmic adaptor subunit n=1 Tax=Methyloversatilis sp. XJ19-49 TaxID=2963429 RepID=UPI00211BF28D|nr:HlyD family type I secretion periplasmic adaptor subunit [Methyloversatilis sp. XJ19-49]MCQ9379067.1 HlyD family type I secretion periplasmic adaptor subunit [Methyloversatilis sp. XJ19-49]